MSTKKRRKNAKSAGGTPTSKNIRKPQQTPSNALLGDIRHMIEETKNAVASTVNAALTMLYWRIGKRIREDILGSMRAEYGKEIVAALRRQLGWTHFKFLIPIDDPMKRDFYAEMCRVER